MRAYLPIPYLLLLLAAPIIAQWPDYPSRGVPKTSDGRPNLEGPAPRTPEGNPDLTGLWQNVRRRGTPQSQEPAVAPDGVPLATFRDVGAGFKDGLPLQPWARDLVTARRAENSKDNPDAHCLPMGLMQFHTHGQPRKIVQTPDVIVIVYEANSGLRQIFTDGRRLPDNDPQPWWYGYSVGKWEGDTLLVETIGLRDMGWLDIIGNPTTTAAKFIERFRRPNFGTLEIDVTIDDPKAYTQPFTVRVSQRLMLNTDLIEFVCGENEKFVPHIFGKK